MELKPVRNLSLTEEVKLYLNKYIKTLDLKQNNKLPSEELLAELIGVSRITIRSALNELASEGIIFRKQGKGTFVNVEALAIKVKFNPVNKFFDMIESSGYKPDVKRLSAEMKKADDFISEILDIDKNSKVIVTKKIFFADSKPCAYCIDYFPKEIFSKGIDLNGLKKYNKSIFEYIYEQTNKKVTWDRVQIETCTNLDDLILTDIFQYEGNMVKSLLLLKGINFDQDDEPIVYAEEYVDTDFIKFNMIRQRNINY